MSARVNAEEVAKSLGCKCEWLAGSIVKASAECPIAPHRPIPMHPFLLAPRGTSRQDTPLGVLASHTCGHAPTRWPRATRRRTLT